MKSSAGLLAILLLLAVACRSPLKDIQPNGDGLGLGLTVKVEDHSRHLSRLWEAPTEPDTPQSRREALERHRANFEADLRAEAEARHVKLDPGAHLQLELKLTSLGEVRAKYIVWGILSGVGWGVGTGLVAHNPALALGLGVYELLEESAFWIGGSLLMGRWSSPAVVEATLRTHGSEKPLWEETYHVLWARGELSAFPPEAQKQREIQLRASLRKVLKEVCQDLETIPAFPKRFNP